MEIKELYLKNFKSFEECTIHFDDYYTAICGKNNSGKSNIIKAIFKVFEQSIFREGFNSNDFPVWKKSKSDELSVIKIKLFLREKSDLGILNFFSMILNRNEDPNFGVSDTTLEISMCQSNKRTETSVIINGEKIHRSLRQQEIFRRLSSEDVTIFHNSTNHDVNEFRRYRRRPRKQNHGELGNLSDKTRDSIDEKVTKIEELLISINNELSESVQKNKSKLQDLIYMLEDKHDIHLNFSDADVNINTDYGNIPYEILLGEEDYKLSLENWGSGTQNRTLILNSIFHAKNVIEQDGESKITPLLIIEEPESFLHPSAQADFGRILQDLSKKLEVQVIVTTHSPYLLSHHNPNSNILIKRKLVEGNLRESIVEKIDDENWKEPFELALGMKGPEFDTLKNAFFNENNSVIFVEGNTDVEYFELMKNHRLGEKKLNFDGEIYAYGGFGAIQNTAILKFLKERFENIIVTFDLDVYSKLKKNLDTTGYVLNKDYFTVGINQEGRDSIEGLLPIFIKNKVNSNNHELIDAMGSANSDTRSSAKNKLKKLYLEEFKRDIKFNDEYFEKFYKLIELINKRNDSL